jgi:Zn-dependent protease
MGQNPMQSADIFYFVVLILSIIMHEVAHGYAAYMLGDQTAKMAGRLTLNPIPHIDPVGSIIVPLLGVLSPAHIFFGWAKPVPYNPYNLRISAGARRSSRVRGCRDQSFPRRRLRTARSLYARLRYGHLCQAAAIIALVNLFLGLFNLIPIPPLDGFTFIRGLLPYRYAMGFRQFRSAARAGRLAHARRFLLYSAISSPVPFSGQ